MTQSAVNADFSWSCFLRWYCKVYDTRNKGVRPDQQELDNNHEICFRYQERRNGLLRWWMSPETLQALNWTAPEVPETNFWFHRKEASVISNVSTSFQIQLFLKFWDRYQINRLSSNNLQSIFDNKILVFRSNEGEKFALTQPFLTQDNIEK